VPEPSTFTLAPLRVAGLMVYTRWRRKHGTRQVRRGERH
jgi:hypothetical protein